MKHSDQGRTPAKLKNEKKQAPWVKARATERRSEDWEKKLLKQTPIWRGDHSSGGSSGGWAFFCPLCRTQRVVKMRPRPESAENLLRVALTTCVLTWAFWSWIGVKGLFLFAPLWAAFEIGYRLSFRSKVACRECGFDAYLYLSDLPKAREEVESFWKKKLGQAEGSVTAGTPVARAAVTEERVKAASELSGE